MMNARMLIGTGFPEEEGRKLADHVMSSYPTLDVQIDVRDCRAALLITAFYRGFVDQIRQSNPQLISAARQIVWVTKYDFQQENARRWMQEYTGASCVA